MIFSSITFLLYFFPVFFLLYYSIGKTWKNYVLLLGSILFYSWGAPKFIYILLGSTILDFYLVRAMYQAKKAQNKKRLLALSVILNVGLLAYFKYANFFIENINFIIQALGGQASEWTKVILPIGISFYTFQTLTYSIDIYRGIHKPLSKVSDYLLYIIMFPQLIAGPIVRFRDVAHDIIHRKVTHNHILNGFSRFCIGLSKKVCIANPLGVKVSQIMDTHDFSNLDSTTAWVGIIAYTFQIYFDFSGYSDMAIGLGKMLGFRFPENFNNPYTSTSITEFWRRWHMTLGTWMRDYLYIPLGGNRVSMSRMYFNLWFVFLISGLWHGASWNFIAWGVFHGFFLVIERVFLSQLLDKIGKFLSWVYCFFITILGWVIFKIENIELIGDYYQKLFAGKWGAIPYTEDKRFWCMMFLATFCSLFIVFPYGKKIHDTIFVRSYAITTQVILTLTALVLFILCVGNIATTNFNPFIYFRF